MIQIELTALLESQAALTLHTSAGARCVFIGGNHYNLSEYMESRSKSTLIVVAVDQHQTPVLSSIVTVWREVSDDCP